jgi:N-hydroxyarylamine O-acetyltransferase
MRFQFTTERREQVEFAQMCDYHQTSPESIFTKQRLATLPTARGRVTLAGDRRIEVCDGEPSVSELASEAEIEECLRRDFGIALA